MRKAKTMKSHLQTSCTFNGPPGKLVYEDKTYTDGTFQGISAYLVDGKDNKLYCQNLALLAKLFIDHKILYFDIRDYQFIVLTQDTMKNKTIK